MAMPQVQQSRTIMYLLILLGFIGGYIYYSQLLVGGVDIQPPVKPKNDISKYESLNINFKALSESDFQSLRVFGKIPVVPGERGNTHIFGPLSESIVQQELPSQPESSPQP